MTKQVRLFSEHEELIPSYAHPSDSGMDMKSCSRKFIFNTTGRKNVEIEESGIKDFIESLKSEFIVSGFIIYDSGVKYILPPQTDAKGMAKSGIFKNAPALSVANSVALIDEAYRDTTKMIFRIDYGYLHLLNMAASIKDMKDIAVDTLLRDIYEVGKPMSQLVIDHREEVELYVLENWKEDYNKTDRGLNGLGSGSTK